jgi:hypothetical protein
MAVIHPQEKELYQTIKNEHVAIDPLIWEAIYSYIGDCVTVVNFIAFYYLTVKQSISYEDAEKITECTKRIETTMKAIARPELNNSNDKILKEIRDKQIVLHPAVKELFTHYIGTDVYVINLAIGSTVLNNENIDQGLIMGILDRTRSIKQFMDKLRQATGEGEGF